MSDPKIPRIQKTKDYNQFTLHDEGNRPLDIPRHKRLVRSMEEYGFIPSMHIITRSPNGNGCRIVKDGQHRLAVAMQLGLPVYFADEEVEFDIAIINDTAKNWTVSDYAKMWSENGAQQYVEGQKFAREYSLPLGQAFALLAGTTSFGNCELQFKNGQFEIRDRAWANAVGILYRDMAALSPVLRKSSFVQACMAICRVESFDSKRLVHKAKRCPEKLKDFSTRDGFMGLLDDIYNFGPGKRVPLKFQAEEAMRKRNASQKKKGTEAGA